MSIDHIAINTSDFHKTVSFYDAILTTLGYRKLITVPGDKAVGFGKRFPSFWIHSAPISNATSSKIGTHIAFVANSRQLVDDFYHAALKYGAKDNGPPGIRKQYHRYYYAAFVTDVDGNNIEAVNHFDWPSIIGRKTIIFSMSILLISFLMIKYF